MYIWWYMFLYSFISWLVAFPPLSILYIKSVDVIGEFMGKLVSSVKLWPCFASCSSLNPVLYGYLDENFKRCFREFCTPSPSVLEMQNSSRTGATSRKLPQREHNSANTGERSNQQVDIVHTGACVCLKDIFWTIKGVSDWVIHFLKRRKLTEVPGLLNLYWSKEKKGRDLASPLVGL